jgi:hypothetical protein
MSRVTKALLVVLPLALSLACNLTAQPLSQAVQSAGTESVAMTSTLESSVTVNEQQAPSGTALPTDTPAATLPPEVAATPGIATTATAFIARQTEMVGTAVAQFGPSANLTGFTIFYSNPVGTPLKSWHDVPIMPEATAGQEFQSDIYSYKAATTLSKATQFYNGKVSSLHWSCFPTATGTGGSGSSAEHDSAFMCGSMTIIVVSFDNDTKHVLVVIEKAQ